MPRSRSAVLLRLAAFAALTFALVALALVVVSDDDGAAPVASSSAALPRGASTEQRVARLASAVREQPRSVEALVALASAHLQSARETGDPGAYERADMALRRALVVRPRDAGALTERGVLRLARHDFRGALADARAARTAAPEVNKPFGVLVDALVELGRYGEAERALQTMVDRKPNLDAYARVAYVRELRGDLAGAEAALRLAISAGGEVPENTAFVTSLLGDLDLVRGRPAAAARSYRAALRLVPGHAPSEYGLARAHVAQGRNGEAITRLRSLVEKRPAPSYAVALAEAELADGRRAAATRSLALVGAQAKLLSAGGVSSDVELALYEADHGSPARAVAIARRVYAEAPSVRSADALGWALTSAGSEDEGLRYAKRAIARGSREPSFLFHAGVAAARTGDRALARRLLASVPRRAPFYGPRAARALERST